MNRLALSPELNASLPDHSRERLAKLDGWNLSRISRRTQKRLGWSRSKRCVAEREYRKFIGLVTLNPNKAYGMAGEVDELWHDHLLHSVDYHAMCREVVGGFVHHCPNTLGATRAQRETISAYNAVTRPDLKRTYAGRVSRIWPKNAAADGVAKCCNHVSEMPPA